MQSSGVSIRTGTLLQFLRFAISCSVALGLKLGAMWACLHFFDPYISYLFVQVFVFFVSYALHVSFSFNSKDFSLHTMWRYFQTVISFKVIDYLVFSVIFAYFHIDALAAVFLTSLAIMTIRFTAVRRSLVRN
jgi:hypothetical protein